LRDVNEGGGITTYSYERIGRVNDVNYADKWDVGYEYEKRGLRTKLTYPDGSYISHEYDELSRLKAIKGQDGNDIAAYEYDELSRRTLLTLGNDANAVYEYDLNNRLTKVTNNIDDTNAITFEYAEYDKVGNRLNMKGKLTKDGNGTGLKNGNTGIWNISDRHFSIITSEWSFVAIN
jgi:uncharacterized protein RhaS with RHS repeats